MQGEDIRGAFHQQVRGSVLWNCWHFDSIRVTEKAGNPLCGDTLMPSGHFLSATKKVPSAFRWILQEWSPYWRRRWGSRSVCRLSGGVTVRNNAGDRQMAEACRMWRFWRLTRKKVTVAPKGSATTDPCFGDCMWQLRISTCFRDTAAFLSRWIRPLSEQED